MRTFKIAVIGVVLFILIAVSAVYLSGHHYVLTAIDRTYLAGHATANINDYREFDIRTIATLKPQPLTNNQDFNSYQLDQNQRAKLKDDGAIAYLVIKDDEVVIEEYFQGYHARSKTNSFSMAKTVLTLMLGVAIEQGLVRSLDQRITDFLPEFDQDEFGKSATIGQLAWMNSGYEWDEQYYTPFSPTVELYYGDNIEDFLLSRSFSVEPASFWEYSSASTQLLGLVLLRAINANGEKRTLSDYLSKHLWQPMQMNDDALWHLDNSGLELTFCCINTNARNFAKLGLLMLQQGRWITQTGSQQLVPADFIKAMITPEGQSYYGLSTWLNMDKQPAHYLFSGHLGQFIIVVPEHNMVVVRLGESSYTRNFLGESAPAFVKLAMTQLGLE